MASPCARTWSAARQVAQRTTCAATPPAATGSGPPRIIATSPAGTDATPPRRAPARSAARRGRAACEDTHALPRERHEDAAGVVGLVVVVVVALVVVMRAARVAVGSVVVEGAPGVARGPRALCGGGRVERLCGGGACGRGATRRRHRREDRAPGGVADERALVPRDAGERARHLEDDREAGGLERRLDTRGVGVGWLGVRRSGLRRSGVRRSGVRYRRVRYGCVGHAPHGVLPGGGERLGVGKGGWHRVRARLWTGCPVGADVGVSGRLTPRPLRQSLRRSGRGTPASARRSPKMSRSVCGTRRSSGSASPPSSASHASSTSRSCVRPRSIHL